MFEVVVQSASKMLDTEAEVEQFITEVQGLLGDTVRIQVNEVTELFDRTGKKVSQMAMRVKELPIPTPTPTAPAPSVTHR